MLHVSSTHLEQVRGFGEKSYPNECCGILVGRLEEGVKRVETLVSARNQRIDSAANRYLIDGDFVNELEKRLRGSGRQIVGFFHSHPDVAARPSVYDREHAWPWYSYLIVSVRNGQAQEALSWTLRDDRAAFEPETLQIVGASQDTVAI